MFSQISKIDYFFSSGIETMMTTQKCIMILFLFTLQTFDICTIAQTSVKKEIDIVFISEIFPEEDSKDIQISFELWTTELFAQADLDYSVNLVLLDSESYLKKDYDLDKTYMVAVSSVDYLRSKEDRSLTPLFTNNKNNSFFLITDKAIVNLTDLRNKRIALVQRGYGVISEFWINYLVQEKYSIKPVEFFSKISLAESESKSINQVFFKSTDACIVRDDIFKTAIELNPQIQNRLHILERSDELLHNVFCLTEKFNNDEKLKIISSVKNFDKTEKGRQILNLFKLNELREFSPDLLEGIDKLYNNSKNKKNR